MEIDENETGCWADVRDVLAAGVDRVLLYGPPGTGKTFTALGVGGHSEEAERLVCTEDMTAGEITGTWLPGRNGQFEWREGPAIRAWRGSDGAGTRLVLDEVDRASGDALSTLLSVTDSSESARWRNPDTLEWVTPGPEFSVVMTSNIDVLEQIPESLLDRFPIRIRIDRPRRDALTSLSEDLREAALWGSCGDPDRRISLRGFYAYDRLRRHYGELRAVALVFGTERAESVLDALRISAMA